MKLKLARSLMTMMTQTLRALQTDANRFSPRTVTSNAGETIIWNNTSDAPHTVTTDVNVTEDDDISLPEGATAFHSGTIDPGDSFAHTFTVPGTYRYICTFHEGMYGTVVVRDTEN